MKFLRKKEDSLIEKEKLIYEIPLQRLRIRELLLKEQHGFCAYSEKFIRPMDNCDVEHFNPGLKGTEKDSYHNWYAVLTWINQHKPKKLDHRFLPILTPCTEDIEKRIIYKNGLFQAKDEGDIEASNFIKFLGINRPEVVQERENHIKLIKQLQKLYKDENSFYDFLSEHYDFLSFTTALENELKMNIIFSEGRVQISPSENNSLLSG